MATNETAELEPDKVIVKFTDREIRLISGSLSAGADQRRLAVLPQVLREWGREDLPINLQHKPEPAERRRDRFRRLTLVEARAKQLNEALAALDETDRWNIIFQLACPPERFPRGLTETNIRKAQQVLEAVAEQLPSIAAAARDAGMPLAPRPGRVRNNVPYLVLMDLAAIFEWTTEKEATRQVDRKTGAESGSFYHFAEAIWPVVFGRGDAGLPAAMQNWASARNKYAERSPLISNIALRHPTWRIYY